MFILNPRLEADSYLVTELELSSLRLLKDSRYPWLMLVPRKPDITELTDLSMPDQQQLLHEINTVMNALTVLIKPDKLNVANLGNVVNQFHVHLVARFKGDAAWPGPIWGQGEMVPYDRDTATAFIVQLQEHLT